jgi:hypothetical protein
MPGLDSDLAESIAALKKAFETRGVPARFGVAEPQLIESLRSKFRIPRRYREFLLACDPLDVETRTPAERVRLLASTGVEAEQKGLAVPPGGEQGSGTAKNGWRASWIVIGHSTLLGDPYFLAGAARSALSTSACEAPA